GPGGHRPPEERQKALAPAVRTQTSSRVALRRSVVEAVRVQTATRLKEVKKGHEGRKELKHSFSLLGKPAAGPGWPCSAPLRPKCPLQTTEGQPSSGWKRQPQGSKPLP